MFSGAAYLVKSEAAHTEDLLKIWGKNAELLKVSKLSFNSTTLRALLYEIFRNEYLVMPFTDNLNEKSKNQKRVVEIVL